MLIPLPYGQVRVCTNAATGSPCTPVASGITDQFGNTVSVVGGNFGQITTDVVGRFIFGCVAGTNYLIQGQAALSNTPSFSYLITCPGVGTAQILATANTWTNTNLFNAAVTFASTTTFNSTNVFNGSTSFPGGITGITCINTVCIQTSGSNASITDTTGAANPRFSIQGTSNNTAVGEDMYITATQAQTGGSRGGHVVLGGGNGAGAGAGGSIYAAPGTGGGASVPSIFLDGSTPSSGALPTTQVHYSRVHSGGGTAVVTGDFTLSAGWGNTATKTAVGGTDAAGFLTITANGAGIAGNPSVTFTFHDGTWGTTVFCTFSRGEANSPGATFTSATGTTSVGTFFAGTPVAATQYTMFWNCQ